MLLLTVASCFVPVRFSSPSSTNRDPGWMDGSHLAFAPRVVLAILSSASRHSGRAGSAVSLPIKRKKVQTRQIAPPGKLPWHLLAPSGSGWSSGIPESLPRRRVGLSESNQRSLSFIVVSGSRECHSLLLDDLLAETIKTVVLARIFEWGRCQYHWGTGSRIQDSGFEIVRRAGQGLHNSPIVEQFGATFVHRFVVESNSKVVQWKKKRIPFLFVAGVVLLIDPIFFSPRLSLSNGC